MSSKIKGEGIADDVPITPTPEKMPRNAQKSVAAGRSLWVELQRFRHEIRVAPVPIRGVSSWDAQSQSPEVISMREEQFPHSISRREGPQVLVVPPPGPLVRSLVLQVVVTRH